MLHLYNKEHIKINALIKYTDALVERELKTSDVKLSFYYPIGDSIYEHLEEEAYIRTKSDEFIIKEINEGEEDSEIVCILNVEELEGKAWDRYESVEQSVTDALNLAIVSTGWSVGHCNVTKKRTVRKSNCSSFEIIQDIKKAYMIDIKFDSINKKINVYEHLGADKGAYFIDSLNLQKLDIKRDSYNFYTRLTPLGKDGLTIKSVNGGKDYVENYQHSKKIKNIIWQDDRYTVAENLKADAIANLNDLSKPRRSYAASIKNLAKSNNKYSFLDYTLGDTITLISKNRKIREKQRIVKIVEHLDKREDDTVEIANTMLSFEELQQELQDAASTINNVTTDNGTVDGSCVDSIEIKQISDFKDGVNKVVNLDVVNANIQNLKANKADIQSLNAVNARIGTLEATQADITNLNAVNAKIDNLEATKAKITDLEVTNAKVNIIEADTGNIKTLLNGNLSSENIQAGGITSDKLSINDGFIKDAMIDTVNASKINSGEINTSQVDIVSSTGGIRIADNTMQFKDKNNKVRVQMGEDESGNFDFAIYDESGTGTLIDATGVKEKALAEGIIKEKHIGDRAVTGKKIEWSSFINEFNNDTNTIKSSKIKLDSSNQTLDVKFAELDTKTTATATEVSNALTKITTQQGQIKTVIENSKLIKDKQLTLEDNYNRTIATVDAINNELGTHKTILDENTGKISSVEVKTNTLERDLKGISVRIEDTNAEVKDVNSKISSKVSEVNSTLDNIKLNITDINKTVNNQEKHIAANSSSILMLKDKIALNVSKEEVKAQLEKATSKTASLELNLNSLTGRVSNIDTTTRDLKVKMAYAEQQLKSDSIINTVSNSIKGVYASKSELKQTADKFELSFKTTGGYNMILDSKNKGGGNWLPVCWDKPNNNDCTQMQPAYLNSDCLSFTQRYINSQGGAMSKPIPVIGGGTYTIAVDRCRMDRGSDVSIEIMCWSSAQFSPNVHPNIKKLGVGKFTYGGYQAKTFTVPQGTTHVNVYLWTKYKTYSSQYDYAHIFLYGLRMNEGTMAIPWAPHPSENYEGITTIDGNGVKCDFKDGSHIEIGKDGFMWHKAGKKFPYYALMHTKLTNVTSADFKNTKDGWYAWKIQLPDEFKGKVFNPFCSVQGYYSKEGKAYSTMTVGIAWDKVNYNDGTFVVECKSVNTAGSTTDYNINVLAWAIA